MTTIKKSVLGVLLTSLCVAAPAFSQSKFEGFSAQLGAGFNSLTAKTAGSESESQNWGQPSFFSTISAGYTYGLNEKFNLTTNLFYLLTKKSIVAFSDSGTDSSIDIKSIWGVTFEPGYAITDNCLGYLKLGYVRASSSLVASETTLADFGTSNGALYGFGVKHFVTDNIFVGMEAYQVAFMSKKSTTNSGFTNKLSMTQGALTMGYQF